MKIDYPYIAAELDRIASLDYVQDMQEAARALAEAIRESQRQARANRGLGHATIMRDDRPIVASWVTWPTD